MTITPTGTDWVRPPAYSTVILSPTARWWSLAKSWPTDIEPWLRDSGVPAEAGILKSWTKDVVTARIGASVVAPSAVVSTAGSSNCRVTWSRPWVDLMLFTMSGVSPERPPLMM